MDSFDIIAKMVGALAIILGLLFMLAYFLKRFGLISQTGQKGFIEVVENRPLLPKRHVSLVRVAGRYFLIGSTDQSVSLLGSIDGKDIQDFHKILRNKEKKLKHKEAAG